MISAHNSDGLDVSGHCRSLLARVVPVLLLAFTITSHAQIVIYKFTGKQTIIGGGQTTKLTVHGYMVVDLLFNVGTSIGAFTFNHQKSFTVTQMENYQFVRPAGAGGTYSVLAKAATPGDQANSTLESAFIQGKETEADVTPLGPLSIPRSFTTAAQNLVNVGGTVAASSASGTGSLDTKGSMTANVNGDSLETVVGRITATLQAAGYRQF